MDATLDSVIGTVKHYKKDRNAQAEFIVGRELGWRRVMEEVGTLEAEWLKSRTYEAVKPPHKCILSQPMDYKLNQNEREDGGS